MNLKRNSLFILLLLLLVGFIAAYYYFSNSTPDIYKDVDNVNYDTVLTSNKPTVYYYYQTTCHFCESIKGEMTKFNTAINSQNKVAFKLVDMKAPENQKAWYDWESHNKKYGENTDPSLNPDYISNPKKMKSVDDIKITGTPTMIFTKNKQVVDYQVGQNVFKLLNSVIAEFNLNVKLDPSVYGK